MSAASTARSETAHLPFSSRPAHHPSSILTSSHFLDSMYQPRDEDASSQRRSQGSQEAEARARPAQSAAQQAETAAEYVPNINLTHSY